MQPLTERVWERHYTELRPYVLERWDRVDDRELQAIGDDYDGLLAVLQRATGRSADAIESELRAFDCEVLGIGTGGDGEERDEGRASLTQLRLGNGFSESDREDILARLDKLNRRLKRFPADGTELELSTKDRGQSGQQVTLTCVVPGFSMFVATSNEQDLRDALADVRDDLWRQIDDAVTKRSGAVR